MVKHNCQLALYPGPLLLKLTEVSTEYLKI